MLTYKQKQRVAFFTILQNKTIQTRPFLLPGGGRLLGTQDY